MTTAHPAAQPGTSPQAAVDAALVLLERMGLSPADLQAAPQKRHLPTFAEYVPGRVGDGQRRLPPGVRLVLEPDHRALGRPPPG